MGNTDINRNEENTGNDSKLVIKRKLENPSTLVMRLAGEAQEKRKERAKEIKRRQAFLDSWVYTEHAKEPVRRAIMDEERVGKYMEARLQGNRSRTVEVSPGVFEYFEPWEE